MPLSPILLLHIGGGTLGLLSGAAAMAFRKGSRRHSIAGTVFVISMLTMSASGTYMAFMKSQIGNVIGGTFTFYLVVTAWITAKRKDGAVGLFDWGAFLFALSLGTTIVALGFQAANSVTGSKDGVPAGMYFFLGSVALLSAAGDLRMLVRSGLSGTQRVVRHLWRVSFAWFVASGSIFLARPHLFPAFMRKTNILFLLGVLPLILMIFWLFRVRFAKAYKRNSRAVGVFQQRNGHDLLRRAV